MKNKIIRILVPLLFLSGVCFQNVFAENVLININTAGFEDLQNLYNIGPVKAQAIIDYRAEHGLFIRIEDIKNVSGIEDTIFTDIQEDITTGAIYVSGQVGEDTVWSPDEGFYVLTGDVEVPEEYSLVIGPGTVVMYDGGANRILDIKGSLEAVGTEDNKINFDFVILNLSSENSQANLDNVSFGSSGGYAVWQSAGVLNIKNSEINNFQNGFLMTGGEALLENNIFNSNTEYAVNASGDLILNLNNNTFNNNSKIVFISAQSDFTHENNIATGAGEKGIEVSGHIKDGSIWHSEDLPFVSTGLIIDENKTLTLSTGTVIKFKSGGYFDIRGNLIISGSADSPIYFTSFKDDLIMGDINGDDLLSLPGATDWNGVAFYPGSEGDLNYVFIQYSGGYAGLGQGSGRSGIFNLGGNINLDNVSFLNNFSSDIYQSSGSLTGTKNDFNSLQTGFVFAGGTASVSQSKFYSETNSIENNSDDVEVDARDNWWGNESGPMVSSNPDGVGGRIYGNVLYEPWLENDPLIAPPRNPVIIVPGIISSKLISSINSINSEIWPAGPLLLFPLDLHLNDLILLEDGITSVSNIEVGDLLYSIGTSDFFLGLINVFKLNDYRENINLFTLPYDWRLNIGVSASKLKEKIDEVKLQTGVDKVDIVAHSMGGLIVKKYLADFGGSSIGKFVDIGTPHTGSPKAFKILSYGDNLDATFFFNLLGLNAERVKIISQNMPSIYQLLPSRNYFDDTNKDYKYYVFDGVSGKDRLSFDQTKDYLRSSGRNGVLIDKADEFHQGVDNLNPADYGVETYNIISCGVPTLGQIFIINEKSPGKFSYNLRMIDGDGTVPLRSAEALLASSTYYFNGIQHALMPSASGIKELVVNLLTDVEEDSNMVIDSSICGIPDGNIISFHSPIELHVYDNLGNHAGPNSDGDIINEINGVVYEVIDDNKFAFLPIGMDYTVNGLAIDSGTFDVLIQEVVGGEVSTTTIFSDLPLTQSTQSKFLIGSTTPDYIDLDYDGDGLFESSHGISSIVSGMVENMITNVPVGNMHEASKGGASSIALSESLEELNIVTDVDMTNKVVSEIEAPLIVSEDLNEQREKFLPEETSSTIYQNLFIEDANKNVATVYQAIEKHIKELFRMVWEWIKSKL